MGHPVMGVVRIWTVLALAALPGAACGRQETQAGRDAGRDTDSSPPLVGGPCTYEHIGFRAVVDSVLTDGALLVRLDTTLTVRGLCDQVREVGGGRWRVPGPAARPQATPGDSVEVGGDVIVTGTCVPCSVATRLLSDGRR